MSLLSHAPAARDPWSGAGGAQAGQSRESATVTERLIGLQARQPVHLPFPRATLSSLRLALFRCIMPCTPARGRARRDRDARLRGRGRVVQSCARAATFKKLLLIDTHHDIIEVSPCMHVVVVDHVDMHVDMSIDMSWKLWQRRPPLYGRMWKCAALVRLVWLDTVRGFGFTLLANAHTAL